MTMEMGRRDAATISRMVLSMSEISPERTTQHVESQTTRSEERTYRP
jgi:hypothetical protein